MVEPGDTVTTTQTSWKNILVEYCEDFYLHQSNSHFLVSVTQKITWNKCYSLADLKKIPKQIKKILCLKKKQQKKKHFKQFEHLPSEEISVSD